MKRYAIGVDLGGTNLRIAAVSDTGSLLKKISLPTEVTEGRQVVVAEMCGAIKKLEAETTNAGNLAGVGIGVPGIIYLKTGMLRKSPNLPGWEDYPVRDDIEAQLGKKVFLDNDANVAAYGESWLGVGKGTKDLCMLTLGTGVGGGLILDGKIWHGFLGMAAELGHTIVAEHGIPCPCGGSGCLETEASATAVVRKAHELLLANPSVALAQASEGPLTSEDVYKVAKSGDAACRKIFESQGRYLGIAIASLVNALNLPLYVIGGGAAAAWDLFAPAMFDEVRERSFIFREGNTQIDQSSLQGDAGLFGAAYLALQTPALKDIS